MCKAERLNSKILIGKMFEGGVSKSFSIFPIRVVYMPVEQGEAPASILISVSKRRFKRAVKRNRVRRRLREIYRLNSHQLKTGWDIVIVARSRCVGAEYSRMDAAFMAACEKMSLRREAKP